LNRGARLWRIEESEKQSLVGGQKLAVSGQRERRADRRIRAQHNGCLILQLAHLLRR